MPSKTTFALAAVVGVFALTAAVVLTQEAKREGAAEEAAAQGPEPPQGGTWIVPARKVPAPAGAGDHLRDSIARTPAPDVEARRRSVPKEAEDWNRLIALRQAQSLDLGVLAEAFKVKVEAEEIDGVAVHRVSPAKVDPQHAQDENVFLFLHGGAYVFGGGENGVLEAVVIAARTGIPVLSVDYRMPPADPFPAAVEDVVKVYRHLLTSREAGQIAIGGTSAGGGLSLAAVHRFIALDLPVPGAIYGGTPWADLTKTGDTLFTLEGLDRVLIAYEGLLEAAALLYADGHDLKDPLISPVYGDFTGFPPTFLVTGTRDMFLSDTARTHRELRRAGAVADLHVFEGLAHADYILELRSPESEETYAELAAFLLKHLGPKLGSKPGASSPVG